MTTSKEPLCQAPFKNIRISMIGMDQLVYRPCCNYVDYNISHKNVNDYVTSPELLTLRQQMFMDKLPSACSTCDREEEQSQVSLRQHMNANKIPYGNNIAQLEVFPSNVCNLRCFMCNPVSSSSIAAEYKAVGWLNNYNDIDTVDQTLADIAALPELHTVSFIGGEFFLAKRATEILSLVRERKLAVSLVTNSTIILPQHLDHLAHIQNLELQISIDATQQAYEFMRYPATWTEVDANIRLLKTSLPQARINFNYVVQPLNIVHLVKTLEYANALRTPLRTTNLLGPLWLNWHILTDQEKQQISFTVKSQFSNQLASKQRIHVESILRTMESCEYRSDYRQEFRRRMNTLMQHRKIADSVIRDHFQLVPSLADFIQNP